MSIVRFEGATRIYPETTTPALASLDLEILDGELVVLVGPSGSGKSTALRMLAGLEGIDGGAILIDGQDVSNLPPKDRNISMVFQDYALYPHMTVADNIGFHLRIVGRPKAEIAKRVAEVASLLDLGDYLDRKPAKLSGGQRQRVAMGRAIIRSPRVFLLDEPLSNLDAKLRVQMRTEIAALQRRLAVTTLFVTHDQTEAMTLGDRVAVLDHGILQQYDVPSTLFDRPANVFVAGFIGSPPMNLGRASVRDGSAHLGPLALSLSRSQVAELDGGDVIVGVRPEGFKFVADGRGLEGVVALVEELGADAYVYTSVSVPGVPPLVVVRATGRQAPLRGTRVGLEPLPAAVHLFNAASGVRLPE